MWKSRLELGNNSTARMMTALSQKTSGSLMGTKVVSYEVWSVISSKADKSLCRTVKIYSLLLANKYCFSSSKQFIVFIIMSLTLSYRTKLFYLSASLFLVQMAKASVLHTSLDGHLQNSFHHLEEVCWTEQNEAVLFFVTLNNLLSSSYLH